MRRRRAPKTGDELSEIGFGAWPIGGEWGDVDEATALRTLRAAVEAGANFFDTADVYGDGRSERLLARLRREVGDDLVIATKVGRRAPLEAGSYTAERLEEWVDRSRLNLEQETLDLVQLHTLPTATYYDPSVFQALDDLVAGGKIRAYGVSVERVEEGLKALEWPNVASVQIIFNVFRQRPAELFLPRAADAAVAVVVRVPLASGLLTGKFRRESEFGADDHRRFNRHGEAFDVGETFGGVPFEEGLEAVEELRRYVPAGTTMAQLALRWILMFDEVTTVIPGAKTPEQARENAAAADLPPLDDATMDALSTLYRDRVAAWVHQRW
ncbi:MAG: aldo/keto reductase [Thermoleophilia bacterium]|nr:aldo/keto reductase [Thermoleophilia bacterium]